MILPDLLSAWGRPEFEQLLKTTLAGMGNELPLQAGLTSGSYALDTDLSVMVISTNECAETIEAKVGVFYQSLTPGCACAGDPTVESENEEHITLRVSINKQTANTSFHLAES